MAQPADQQATGPSLAQLARVRAEILAAATRHGATNVRVFGSVARGDADAASDVDFLVDFEQGRSLLHLASLPAFSWSSRTSSVAPSMSSPSRASRPGSASACWPRRSRLRSDRERLHDILESIQRIEAQAARGRAAFAADELAQTAVVRWVEIIGKLGAQIRAIMEEVP